MQGCLASPSLRATIVSLQIEIDKRDIIINEKENTNLPAIRIPAKQSFSDQPQQSTRRIEFDDDYSRTTPKEMLLNEREQSYYQEDFDYVQSIESPHQKSATTPSPLTFSTGKYLRI